MAVSKGSIFELGKKYKSYEDIQVDVNKYENETFTKYWKRDAALITSAKNRGYVNPQLKYWRLKYCCIFGGQNFQSRGKNVRDSRTFRKQDLCPAHILFSLTSNNKCLKITRINSQHNHDVNKQCFDYLPQERKMTQEIKEKAKEAIALRANPKLLKAKLEEISGKRITLKDLSNLKYSEKKCSQSLDYCVDVLQKKYKAELSLYIADDNVFGGIFIQTQTMKKNMEAFPEFLSVDGTYKLLNIGIPVFLIVVEGGNCETEIVALCLLTREDRESLHWFLKTFQEKNSNWKNTQCIMTDKDLTERDVIKELFPSVNIILCIFHSMRTFSREISCSKMGITPTERTLCLEIVQKMIYAKTDSEFDLLYNTLKTNAPKAVLDYFNKNWYTIKDEWSMSRCFNKKSFLNATNNRIESINAKLKSVINKHSSLEEFIESFFTIQTALEDQRDYKAMFQLQKRVVNTYPVNSAEQKYTEFLTQETGKMVIRQLEYSKKIHQINNLGNNCFVVNSSEGSLQTTPDNCSCNFASSMLMPCRHIFAVREMLQLQLFCPELVHPRWTLHYYKKHQRYLSKTLLQEEVADVVTNETLNIVQFKRNLSPLSYGKKRKKALLETDILADLAAQTSNANFEQRLETLKSLAVFWKQGVAVRVICINENDDNDIQSKPILHAPNLEEKMETILRTKTTINEQFCEATRNTQDLKERDKNFNFCGMMPLEDYNRIPTILQDHTYSNLSGEVINVKRLQTEETNLLSHIKDFDLDLNIIENLCEKNEMSSQYLLEDYVTGIHVGAVVEVTYVDNTSQENFNAINTNKVKILQNIKLPGVIKKRGRPKGNELTAIGLPKRKKTGFQEFERLFYRDKQRLLISWIIEQENLDAVINGFILVDDTDVKETLPYTLLNKEVNLGLIRSFFTNRAWKKLQNLLDEIKDQPVICFLCSATINVSNSVMCNSCLLWYHLACTSLTKIHKNTKKWFCFECKKK